MYESVLTSDWHFMVLKKFFSVDTVSHHIAEVEKPFKYAAQHGIKHVDILGDITHVPQLPEEYLIALVTLILRYDEHIKIRYITGNHDHAHVGKTSATVLKFLSENGMFKNFRVFDAPKMMKIGGVKLCYMPYPYTEAPDSDGDPRLILAHIEAAGAIGDNGRPMKSVGNHHKIVNRTEEDYVWSGHLHTFQILKKQRTGFCGSLFQTNFGESGPKGFVHLKAAMKEGRLLVSGEHINSHPNFTLKNHTVESADEFEEIIRDNTNFYKITLADGVVAPKNLLREAPHIISMNGRTLRPQEIEQHLLREMPKVTLLTGLVDYLMKHELSDREVKKAVRLVKAAIKDLRDSAKLD